MESELNALLARNGLARFAPYAGQLAALTADLLDYNRHVNLTAIRDEAGVYLRHIADSLTLEPSLPSGASLLDVGCGGGFPSLPLAMVRPDLRVTSLDSTKKKLAFIDGQAEKHALGLVTCCARAEEMGKGEARETFDAVCARGVAELRMLCELCLPLVRVGGKCIAMKNGECEEELMAAAKAIKALGGELAENAAVTLTDGTVELHHAIIVLQKVAPTPKNYPRDWNHISKKPL